MSLLVRFSSFAEAGICEEVWGERWEFVHRKIPQSQEKLAKQEPWCPDAAARSSNVWTESASRLPRHQCWFYTNSSSAFKLSTTRPRHAHTYTLCVATLRASSQLWFNNTCRQLGPAWAEVKHGPLCPLKHQNCNWPCAPSWQVTIFTTRKQVDYFDFYRLVLSVTLKGQGAPLTRCRTLLLPSKLQKFSKLLVRQKYSPPSGNEYETLWHNYQENC